MILVSTEWQNLPLFSICSAGERGGGGDLPFEHQIGRCARHLVDRFAADRTGGIHSEVRGYTRLQIKILATNFTIHSYIVPLNYWSDYLCIVPFMTSSLIWSCLEWTWGQDVDVWVCVDQSWSILSQIDLVNCTKQFCELQFLVYCRYEIFVEFCGKTC